MSADGVFRTQDMSLAAILCNSGFKYELERVDRRCAWKFDCPEDREEDFDELVDGFIQYECRVEPRKYMADVARMREEMYRFLGIGDRRVKPNAPSAQAV